VQHELPTVPRKNHKMNQVDLPPITRVNCTAVFGGFKAQWFLYFQTGHGWKGGPALEGSVFQRQLKGKGWEYGRNASISEHRDSIL